MQPLDANDEGGPPFQHADPVFKIVVGDEEAVFKVNKGILSSTSFVTQHGLPGGRSARLVETVKHEPVNPMFFTDEDNVEPPPVEKMSETIDLTDEDADYWLKDKFFYRRDAFNLFISYLHNAPLPTPTTQDDRRALFRTYALAHQYDVHRLQNAVIDTLQKYYFNYGIPISDLLWVVSKFSNMEDGLLTKYLINQTGYEMACGWDQYRNANSEVVALLNSGQGVILDLLFQASLKHSHPTNKADPARNKKDWRLNTV